MPELKLLHHGQHGDTILGYHYAVLGLAWLYDCPYFDETSIMSHSTMTSQLFNKIVDWLCENKPNQFQKE